VRCQQRGWRGGIQHALGGTELLMEAVQLAFHAGALWGQQTIADHGARGVDDAEQGLDVELRLVGRLEGVGDRVVVEGSRDRSRIQLACKVMGM
jgi:hypothetical protein